MLPLTQPGQIWSIIIFSSEAATALIGLSITFLVLSQLVKDRKSIAFIILIFNISIFGATCCICDLCGHFYPALLITVFNFLSIVGAALPATSFYFLMEFLEIWTRQLRLVFMIEIAYIFILAIFAVQNDLWISVKYLPDGTYTSSYYPLAGLFLFVGETGYFYTFGMLIKAYFQRQIRASRLFFIGITFIHLAGFSYLIPVLPQLSVGTDFFAIASLALVGPVLRQRLFEPLSQLNRKLKRQTVLLKNVSLVGQRLVSSLDINSLLNAIVQDIRTTFGYLQVSLYLLEGDHLVLNSQSASAMAPSQLFDSYDINDKDLPLSRAFRSNEVVFEAQALTAMISIVDNDAKSVGVLVINVPESLIDEEQEVFRLLSLHISTAIHNASLFKQVQTARSIADEASEAKTRFLSIMSHDLRTPLQAIILNAQFLGHLRPGLLFEQGDYDEMMQITNASLDMKQLVDKILDFSRIEAGQLDLDCTAFEFVPSMVRVKDTLLSLLSPGVNLTINLKTNILPLLYADEIKFREILTNLVSNSCKFCTAGYISMGAEVYGNMMLFSVTDTGPGIPDDLRPTLFERFKQARNLSHTYGGSRLGLSICKLLVNLQGGEIWVDSKIGKGTTFYFTLPIANTVVERAPLFSEREDKMPIYRNLKADAPYQAILIGTQISAIANLEALLSSQGYESFYIDVSPEQAIELITALEPRLAVVMHERNDLWSDWIVSIPQHMWLDTTIIEYIDYRSINDFLLVVNHLVKSVSVD